MTPPLLTVIIPTLNEEENLPSLLRDLREQKDLQLEIIVADGGSRDCTCSIATSFSIPVVFSKTGRGAQMNTAARGASGEYLLFLHADSRLESSDLLSKALYALRRADEREKCWAGHFPLHFVRTSNCNAMAYRYAEEKSAFNRVNTTNGDQGLLLSRDFFHRLGGFDESLPFLEDQRLAEKIRAQGKWITLPGALKTSARRFEREGFHRRYILMSIIMGLHSVGVEEFFLRAPGVYRLQEETGKLLLSPFFALIRKLICEWGWSKTIRIFYLLGRYIRQNSWQMFFFFDVGLRSRLGEGRYPFLSFHDRLFWPLTNFKICDAVTGGLCFLWFLGILAPFFWLTDQFHGKKESE